MRKRAPFAIAVALTCFACGEIELPKPPDLPNIPDLLSSSDDEQPCGPSNCKGCCVLGSCVTQAEGCGGRDCAECLSCGPQTCAGCCANGQCVTTTTPSACGGGGLACFACGEGQVCDGTSCAVALGRWCWGNTIECAQGTECQSPWQLQNAGRCWTRCDATGRCDPGFDCVDSDMVGWRMCLPVRTPDSTWMLSGYVVGWSGDSREVQICYSIGATAYCRGFRKSIDTEYEFGPFGEDQLASVHIDLWRLSKGVLATDCIGKHCSAATQGRISLLGSTAQPIDLRPSADVRASSTVLVPIVAQGKPTTLEVRARVELTQ